MTGANTGGGSHVNGARDRAFNYTLDGIDINETLSGGSEFSPLRTNPDSLQEFRVITSNATAEYGRSSGAQVALVTKSGTIAFHGNLFYFYRGSALAANEWENNLNNRIAKPFLPPASIRWRCRGARFIFHDLARAGHQRSTARIVRSSSSIFRVKSR